MGESEEISILQIPESKIYKEQPIRVATLLGGPLVAGYLMAQNFKAFNQPDKAKWAWIISILTTIAVFTAAFFIPFPENGPKYIIPLIYAWIAFYLVKKFQGGNITAHVNAGGQVYNWWRILAVSLVGIIVTVILVVIIALLLVGKIPVEG